jgi:hypothetical protein
MTLISGVTGGCKGPPPIWIVAFTLSGYILITAHPFLIIRSNFVDSGKAILHAYLCAGDFLSGDF